MTIWKVHVLAKNNVIAANLVISGSISDQNLTFPFRASEVYFGP